MKFKFDWEDVVRGTIEIDAKNGSEAEMMFRQMSSTERQSKSIVSHDEGNAKIKFIDFEWSDTLTYEEWKSVEQILWSERTVERPTQCWKQTK